MSYVDCISIKLEKSPTLSHCKKRKEKESNNILTMKIYKEDMLIRHENFNYFKMSLKKPNKIILDRKEVCKSELETLRNVGELPIRININHLRNGD